MTKEDDALASFMGGFTCSSAIFSTFSKEMGLDPSVAKKVACGFGAGISKTGNICGAVSGAVLVIGLKYGKESTDDTEATDRTRALVREFIKEFTEKNGSVNCTELLGFNLHDPGEYTQARESGLFISKCPELVRDAVIILEKLLPGEAGD
jgi:C_GCAxxG_C_C family probable redox protein